MTINELVSHTDKTISGLKSTIMKGVFTSQFIYYLESKMPINHLAENLARICRDVNRVKLSNRNN